MPENLGQIEVIREEVDEKRHSARLLLDFLDLEGRPIASPPTVATLKPRGREISLISFKPVKGDDPSKAGSLESNLFETGGDISGELTTTMGGKPMTITINLR